MAKAPKPMSRAEARVQRHILKRMLTALGDRSWNWLATETGIPQSTLYNQYAKSPPAFTIETLVLAAPVLKKPLVWFLPGTPEIEADAAAFREIADLIRKTEHS